MERPRFVLWEINWFSEHRAHDLSPLERRESRTKNLPKRSYLKTSYHTCLLLKLRYHLAFRCINCYEAFDRKWSWLHVDCILWPHPEIASRLGLLERWLHEPLTLTAHSRLSAGIQLISAASDLLLTATLTAARPETATFRVHGEAQM